jgi:NAD+ diphosphatase
MKIQAGDKIIGYIDKRFHLLIYIFEYIESQYMAIDPFSAALPPITGMAFVDNPLDRADHIRADSSAMVAVSRDPAARVLGFVDLNAALSHDGLLWLPLEDVPSDSTFIFLGLEAGAPRFAAAVPKGSYLPGQPTDARQAAMILPAAQSAMLGQGRALLAWHGKHGHCAVCGAPTAMSKAGYARQCANDACKAEHFPRTDPVTIMLVVDGDRCLLGRQPTFPKGFYSALAGFLEPGETIEAAVRREVREEAGIDVGRVRYVASQPWPFPSSLMIGCFAEALSDQITVDETELEDARWFSRQDCQAVFDGNGPFICPPPLAIAHHLLKTWLALERAQA